jgi:Fur family ferric uptake transcriptional regulator
MSPLPAPDVDAAVHVLRDRGLRASAARRLVLEALFAAERPVSAEEIAGGIGGRVPRSDLASVYRNLETLEELGLARHVHLGHGPGLYAMAGADVEYVVCERCSAFRALAPARLDRVRDEIRSALGYEARFTHFPIVGLCAECAGAGPGDE